MKRYWIVLLVLLSFSLCGIAHADTSTTLLIYMCGADLQEDACEDIDEMLGGDIGDDINIVILAGGATKWDYDDLEGGTRNLITLTDDDFSVTDWGWESMGSAECLLEFLEYGLTEYPADRTIVILWNHGAGSEGGMCFDATTEDEDGLTLNEINDVLYDLDEALDGFHIDLFGCDACLMATYEMAAMLSNYDIDYFVASEELEPGIGWNYTPWVEALSDDPDISTDALCRVILEAFMDAGLEDDPIDVSFCFVLNAIWGDNTMTDPIDFVI